MAPTTHLGGKRAKPPLSVVPAPDEATPGAAAVTVSPEALGVAIAALAGVATTGAAVAVVYTVSAAPVVSSELGFWCFCGRSRCTFGVECWRRCCGARCGIGVECWRRFYCVSCTGVSFV